MSMCRFVSIDIGSCLASSLVGDSSSISSVLSDCGSSFNVDLVSIGS